MNQNSLKAYVASKGRPMKRVQRHFEIWKDKELVKCKIPINRLNLKF